MSKTMSAKSEKYHAVPLFPDLVDSKKILGKEPSTKRQKTEFTSTSDLLKGYQVTEKNKHIAHEFQSFGCHLAEVLADKKHTALYIKLAKTLPRGVLETALSFVIDSRADNKAKLFMWKLKQLKEQKQQHETLDH